MRESCLQRPEYFLALQSLPSIDLFLRMSNFLLTIEPNNLFSLRYFITRRSGIVTRMTSARRDWPTFRKTLSTDCSAYLNGREVQRCPGKSSHDRWKHVYPGEIGNISLRLFDCLFLTLCLCLCWLLYIFVDLEWQINTTWLYWINFFFILSAYLRRSFLYYFNEVLSFTLLFTLLFHVHAKISCINSLQTNT